MIKTVIFSEEHIPKAKEIALENYLEEKAFVKELPIFHITPDLKSFADNGLGVALVDNDEMLGFLCCYRPWDNAFNSAARGTFSPIHAHGAVSNNREKIYKRLYQGAGEIWVKQGIAYHSIALYAHDLCGLRAFFDYGFGNRCIDAIRPMENFLYTPNEGIFYGEIVKNESSKVRELRKMLTYHLGESPCFMKLSPSEVEAWLKRAESRDSRLFAAFENEKVIAFMEVMDEGENFATEHESVQNICGAFTLPEYRGKGVTSGLLNFLISKLNEEGYGILGVDFESFNPTAAGFWLKYFTAYTKGVVRRIDECAFR